MAPGDFSQAVGNEGDHHGVDAYPFFIGPFLQITMNATGQTGHKAGRFFRLGLAPLFVGGKPRAFGFRCIV
jgi:hypothetical protein